MAQILTENAYGKLNLTLDVLGRRPDGYHDLRMVMCSVALHDDITIALGTGTSSCLTSVGAAIGRPRAKNSRPCDGQGLPTAAQRVPEGKDNLAFRAAQAYFSAAGIDPGGFSIQITKRIPMQAGMAGGSSDAAAVLRALNRRYRAFSDAALRALGLTLGSDVPYCLFGGVALAEGRGERLTRLPDLPDGLCFVLVKPTFSVSTPALFRALDERLGIRDPGSGSGIRGSVSKTGAMLEALQNADAAAIGRALANDFAPVLAAEHPVIETVKETLLAAGACGSELTGTGSVIFGVFDSEDRARAAAQTLAAQFPFTAVTRPVSCPAQGVS